MIDNELVLVEKQSFKTSVTSRAEDLIQKTPNLGQLDAKLFVIFTPASKSEGTGTITFTIEDSADGSTGWTAVAAYGPFVANDITHDIAFKFPFHHRRYVRVKTAISGTIATLDGSLYMGDGYSDPAGYWRDEVEFFEPDPDAMKIDLTTKVKGVLPKANGGTGSATGS